MVLIQCIVRNSKPYQKLNQALSLVIIVDQNKSVGRIERSKQMLSKSCERTASLPRKQSKKKHMDSKKKNNKVIQIVQNQCINLKTPNTTELVFNWPMKTNNTVKNEYIKRAMNESKLGFHKDRQNSLESKRKCKFVSKLPFSSMHTQQ